MATSHRSIRSLAVVLMLGACGGDGDGAGSTVTVGPAPDSVTSSTATSSSGSSATTEAEEEDERVPGPAWGLDDPPIPDQYGAFARRSTGELDCEAVEGNTPDDSFWTTVGAVCRALRDGEAWPSGPLADPPSARNGFQDCMNQELAAVVRALLEWTDAHPGRQPVLELAAGSARSQCEFNVYDTQSSILPPSEDRENGGLTVQFQVPGLDRGDVDPTVLIDGQEVPAADTNVQQDEDNDGLARIRVFLPAPVEAHRATVEVLMNFGEQRGTVDLLDVDVPETTTTTT